MAGSELRNGGAGPLLRPRSRRASPAEFLSDLGRASAAWRSAPLLPVFSVSVALVGQAGTDARQTLGPTLGGLVTLAAIPVWLFTAGSVGTERLWYAAAFRGERMPVGALWGLTWGLMPRYVHLGLIVSWPILVLFIGGLVLATSLGAATVLTWFYVGLYVIVVVTDVLLTFATPALAYTTRSAPEALRLGVGMIRRLWPASALYAVVPPLAIVVVARANPQQFAPLAVLLFTAASTLLNLLLKGATAAFYLRHQAAQGPEVGG